MLRQSFGSVEVIWLDRGDALEAVETAVGQLAVAHPEIERVILFGSMALVDAVPDGDVALLIVLATSDEPFLDRIGLYKPSGIPTGVEVFAYTEEEFKRMPAQQNPLLKHALTEGVVLFERSRLEA